MQLSHTRPVVSASFDEPNLVAAAGLAPLMALAGNGSWPTGSWPTDKGANAGLKVSAGRHGCRRGLHR